MFINNNHKFYLVFVFFCFRHSNAARDVYFDFIFVFNWNNFAIYI